jgi:hypothetical protein
MRNPALLLAFTVALAGAGAGACKKKEAAPPPTTAPPGAPAEVVRVTEVQVGNALGADKRVTAPMEAFTKKDTIFASVVTEGKASSAELAARWTFQDGQLVNETKRSIAPMGTDVTEFSIQKPDGWPAGDYKVEIALNGKPVQSKTFKVQ